MANFTTLQTRVKRRVIDLPTAVTAEVPTLINEVIRDLADEHNFRVMEAEATFTTADGTRLLGTIADLKEIRSKPYIRIGQGGALGTRNIAFIPTKVEVVKLYSIDDTAAAGEPRHLLQIVKDKDTVADFEVYPFPNTASQWNDGNYRVVIPYWKYLADLSDDADTNWFTTNVVQYIVLEATSRAFYLNWDENRGALWSERAAVHGRRAVKVDKRSRLGRSTTLTPRYDVNATKFAWRE